MRLFVRSSDGAHRLGTGALRTRCAENGLCRLTAVGITVQRVDECCGVKRPQVGDLLSDADESHRHLQLITDPEHDAALRRAVELREDDTGDLYVGLECLGLRD